MKKGKAFVFINEYGNCYTESFLSSDCVGVELLAKKSDTADWNKLFIATFSGRNVDSNLVHFFKLLDVDEEMLKIVNESIRHETKLNRLRDEIKGLQKNIKTYELVLKEISPTVKEIVNRVVIEKLKSDDV